MQKFNALPAAWRANFHLVSILANDARMAFAAAAADRAADKSVDEAAWVAAFSRAFSTEWWAASGAYEAALREATDFAYLGDEAIQEARRLTAA